MPRRRWAYKASSKTPCCLSALQLFLGFWFFGMLNFWISQSWHVDKDPLNVLWCANEEAFDIACATLGYLWWSWKSCGWRSEAEFFPSIFFFEGRRLESAGQNWEATCRGTSSELLFGKCLIQISFRVPEIKQNLSQEWRIISSFSTVLFQVYSETILGSGCAAWNFIRSTFELSKYSCRWWNWDCNGGGLVAEWHLATLFVGSCRDRHQWCKWPDFGSGSVSWPRYGKAWSNDLSKARDWERTELE